MQKLAAGFIILWLTTVPQLLWGETIKITMAEAIKEAIANNHNLKAAAFEKDAAGQKVLSSRAAYLPQLTLEESGAYTNSATRSFMMRLDEGRFALTGDLNHPTASGDFRTSLTLEQPLFDRQIATTVSMAKNLNEASELALQRRAQSTAYRTVSAFLEVQQTKTRLKLAEDALADAREHQRLAVVRSGAGVGLRSDELRARTFASEMEQQLITAGNSLEIARYRLAQVVGREVGEKLDIDGEFSAPALRSNLAELLDLGLKQRSELKEMQKQLEQAELGLESARNAYWPTARAAASYQLNDHSTPFGRDNDSWMVGATLRWELYEGGKRGDEKNRATALKDSALEYLAEQRQEVSLQITEKYLRREELGKRLEVARHSVLEAEEVVRLLTKRYENSLALMVELLDSQTMLNRARGTVADTEAEYAKAWASLLFVSGRLLEEIER